MYFDGFKYKIEHPVIQRGGSSRSYWVVYEPDNDPNFIGAGVEKWRIPSKMENMDILLGYVAALKVPVLFCVAFLPYRNRINATINNANFT